MSTEAVDLTAARVHPSSVVDAGATIGAGTRIWHFCHISAGATLGENCVVGQGVYIGDGVQIGSGVKIQNNVSVYSGVTLEDEVFLGPSMVFTNVVNPRSHVSRKDEFQPTLVQRGATIGANATIICGVTLGRYAFVGAGALVSRDVPDFALVYGSPAVLRGWMCRCGERLPLSTGSGQEQASCPRCATAYSRQEGRVLMIDAAP